MELKPKIFKLLEEYKINEKHLPNYQLIYANTGNFFDEMVYGAEWYYEKEFNPEMLESIISEVRKVFTDNKDIVGVYHKYEIESLIIAGIFEELKITNIKHPSFESIFISHNKYYSRMNETNPIKFTYIDIDDENWEKNVPSFPFFFKPVYMTGSVHQYIIKDIEQLRSIVEILKKQLNYIQQTYIYLANKYLDIKNYPLALKNLMLCEEKIEGRHELCWEGWVDDEGNVNNYCFIDEISKNDIFVDWIMPSKHSKECLNNAHAICTEYIKKAKFKNSFCNFDLWVDKNDNIQIIECNPRLAYSFDFQYRMGFGTDILNSAIQLSMGNKVTEKPYDNKNFKYCNDVFITTKQNGIVSDIMDVKKFEEIMKNNPTYQVLYNIELDFEIKNNVQKGGRNILSIFITNDTYDGALIDADRIRKELLPKDDFFR